MLALPVLIGLLIVGILVLLGLSIMVVRWTSSGSPGKRRKQRDRNTIIKDANRKLSQNPKDTGALSDLAEVYYKDREWEKAYSTYTALMQLVPTSPELDDFTITLRRGLSALHLKKWTEAYKDLSVCRNSKQDVFEVNHNLGYLEFRRKRYERAVALLKQASEQQPEHTDTLRYLGQSLYRMKEYKAAGSVLKRAVEQAPGDKESMFVLGQCAFELGQQEQALRTFTHLRGDPVLGPSAALRSGSIRMQHRRYKDAIMDFQIGLRHEQIAPELSLELKYRLAAAHSKNQELDQALPLLREVYSVAPSYKDVAAQLSQVEELNSNRHLQTYLIGASSDFVTLCRRIVSNYFKKAHIKVTDIHVEGNEYADILAEVETSSWEDLILFRFMRTNGAVGELMLRDFHTRIKDVKAGRGLCLSAGTYTEGAQAFVEARLIDLLGKDELNKILERLAARG
ncbi:MAG: hypothetical protein EA383_17655 [Spirochaetaceae bacterium]|nr:MAG: hypothetical protein EA383_17655 [Spirochaetaceae bacterium]